MFVSDTNFYFFKTGESIEFTKINSIETIQLLSVTHCNSIEPTAPAGTSCGGTVFFSFFQKCATDFVKEFSGKRAFSYASGIDFCNSIDFINCPRVDAETYSSL